MTKLVLNKFAFIFMLSLIFLSCKNNKIDKWNGNGFIKHEGNYKTNNGYTIIVKNNKNLISYKVIDSLGRIICFSPHKMSSYSKWYLYWKKNILWVYSGDIGSSFWDCNKNKPEQQFINEKKLHNHIPDDIKNDFINY